MLDTWMIEKGWGSQNVRGTPLTSVYFYKVPHIQVLFLCRSHHPTSLACSHRAYCWLVASLCLPDLIPCIRAHSRSVERNDGRLLLLGNDFKCLRAVEMVWYYLWLYPEVLLHSSPDESLCISAMKSLPILLLLIYFFASLANYPEKSGGCND